VALTSTSRLASPANPFDVSGPYATATRLALAMALLPGLGTGLLLVLVAGAGLPLTIGWPQLAQAHGQIQTLGFVLLFIVAVGLQLFPRFLGSPLQHAERATWGAWGISTALVLRLLAQPLDPGPLRMVGLAVAGLLLPASVLLAGSAFHGLSARSVQPRTGPAAGWRRFILVGGLTLGAALVLSVWSSLELAFGDIVIEEGLDEALIQLELLGFATCMVFAVASRVFGRFLLLRTRPGLDAHLGQLAAAWGLGVLLVGLGWMGGDAAWAAVLRSLGSLIELIVVGVWLWLSALFAAPSRASGTPYVTNPTRRWVRFAFGFLLFGVALQAALFWREAWLGIPPMSTELSAARHAMGQGFLLPMMVSMAVRLLPILSADVLKHRQRLEATVDVLLIGALVRVAAELLGGYDPVAGPLIALGGTLTYTAFAVFSLSLWSSTTRLPR
jgi:hypothetical protein